MPEPRLLRRHADFRRLWIGQGVSDLGSAASSLAFPLVGVLLLHTSELETALVAACAFLPQGLLALPAGPFVERRRKRPLMVGADLTRAVLLISLPVAQWAGALAVPQLLVVALGCGVCALVFSLADQAHLPDLVPANDLAEAVSVQASTSWLSSTAGPALGGWLVAMFGPARTLLLDALSFLVSAAAVLRIRTPESPAPAVHRDVRAAVGEGLRYMRSSRPLRRLLWSGAVLSWSISFVSPIELLFLLRTLHATPTQYGIALAAPCAAGFAGSLVVRRCLLRWGATRVLFWSAVARCPWMLVIPFARPGVGGVVLVSACWGGLLATASVYNAAQTVYRQMLSPPEMRSRIVSASKCVLNLGKPVAPLLGGLLAAGTGLRTTLFVGAVALCAAPLLLDRHEQRADDRVPQRA